VRVTARRQTLRARERVIARGELFHIAAPPTEHHSWQLTFWQHGQGEKPDQVTCIRLTAEEAERFAREWFREWFRHSLQQGDAEKEQIRRCAHPDGCQMPAAQGDTFCEDCRSAWNAECERYAGERA